MASSRQINNILQEELKRISLSNDEEKHIKGKAKEFVDNINKVIRKLKIKAQAKIGGSLAKNTLIKKQIQDIDIFVVFENEDDLKQGKFFKILDKLNLRKLFSKSEKSELRKKHGSRDYFQILFSNARTNLVFEIIPVLKISKQDLNDRAEIQERNITDFSLMHVDYVKKKIKENTKLADDIKLAKSFCHACDCYGAESYINGFSGYALEILILHFKGFTKFLRELSKKKLQVKKNKIIIDIEKQFKNKGEILREINESKLLSPLIVIDPTYKFRNVTAALSYETFEKFLKSAEKFLKNPSKDFFQKQGVDIKKLKKFANRKNTKKYPVKFLHLKINTNRQEGDIAGSKMKKFFDFLCNELERKQQEVIAQKFSYSGQGQKADGYIVLKLQKEIEIGNVPANMKHAVKNFKSAHKNEKVYRKKGRLYVKKKFDLDDFFRDCQLIGDETGVHFEIVSD